MEETTLEDVFDTFDEINQENKTNSISLNQVFEFILDSNQETIIRILDFAKTRSGLCSIKEASEQRGIKPPSYCQNEKYKKYDFLGKTFGYEK